MSRLRLEFQLVCCWLHVGVVGWVAASIKQGFGVSSILVHLLARRAYFYVCVGVGLFSPMFTFLCIGAATLPEQCGSF